MKKLFYGKQHVFNNSKRHIIKSLFNQTITQGEYLKIFENKICKYLKVKNTLVCNSGTAAIHMAFHAINLQEKDNILMPSINFIAAYNMAKLFKAKIHLIDVDKDTGQICIKSLIEYLKKNKIKKVKAIVSMYLGGYPENISQLFKLKKKLGCYLIEDACHAFGSEYYYSKKRYKVGSCKHADVSLFSFHPLKTITTGEGGALTTNNNALYKRAESFRSHGIIRYKNKHWTYKINKPGFNYRLSELNCSLGVTQLEKINQILGKREKLKNLYIKSFQKLKNVIKLPKYEKCISSNHLFLILINFKKIKSSKNKFFIFMKNKGIYLQQHYIPLYRLTGHKIPKKNFPNTEKYFEQSVSLPIHFDISVKDINKVIKEIENFMLINK